MGLRERWHALWSSEPPAIEVARKLDVKTGYNVRELGGYAVGAGETAWHRMIRSGSIDMLSEKDQRRLHDYGVRAVLDLRGFSESRVAPDKLAAMDSVRFKGVPFYDFNISDPKLERPDDSGGCLTLGYLTMLANHEAVREIFAFVARCEPEDCLLFHCAAGMDRTGMCAMLLLGVVGASRERIVADYCYSFGSVEEVDAFIYDNRFAPSDELLLRRAAIEAVYDRLMLAYGSFEEYLGECGVTDAEIARVRAHLLRSCN